MGFSQALVVAQGLQGSLGHKIIRVSMRKEIFKKWGRLKTRSPFSSLDNKSCSDHSSIEFRDSGSRERKTLALESGLLFNPGDTGTPLQPLSLCLKLRAWPW